MERSLQKWLPGFHPEDKMLFLSGPRQVGKTTLAKYILEQYPDKGIYLNWDISEHRHKILSTIALT